MELKVKSEKLKVILGAVSLLIALPLLGFSCGNGDKTKERETAVAEPEASLSQDTDADQEEPQESKIPEGWKVYESKRLNLSFAYPPDWYVLEDERLGILFNTIPFPRPLPPDILGVPVVISQSEISDEQILIALQDEDPFVKVESYSINGNDGKVYAYHAGPDAEWTISYRFPRGEYFIVFSLDGTLNPSVTQTILETLLF